MDRFCEHFVTTSYLRLCYQDGVPDDYFADFVSDVNGTGTALTTETREKGVYASLEWIAPTVIALYIAKAFADDLLTRAATDFGDAVYPKLKAAVLRLVNKIFVKSPLRFKVISAGANKISNADALIFSIYAVTNDNKRIKFIFHEALTEAECVECIDALFVQLADHYSSDVNDSLTRQIALLSEGRSREIFTIYNKSLREWSVVDPVQMAVGRCAQSPSDDVAS